MAQWIAHKPLIVALLLLLMASLAGNVLLYRQASRQLFEEGDRPLIERTIALSPQMGSEEDTREVTFPIVMSWGDRTCVELRRYDGLGYTGACYDRQGRLIEERAGVH